MSRHEMTGFRNARKLSCGCRAWFEKNGRLLWIEACRGNCPAIENCVEIGERRGFVVAVLDDGFLGGVGGPLGCQTVSRRG